MPGRLPDAVAQSVKTGLIGCVLEAAELPSRGQVVAKGHAVGAVGVATVVEEGDSSHRRLAPEVMREIEGHVAVGRRDDGQVDVGALDTNPRGDVLVRGAEGVPANAAMGGRAVWGGRPWFRHVGRKLRQGMPLLSLAHQDRPSHRDEHKSHEQAGCDAKGPCPASVRRRPNGLRRALRDPATSRPYERAHQSHDACESKRPSQQKERCHAPAGPP